MTIDGRADYIALSRPDTLDSINEIQATADEGRRFLNRAYQESGPQRDWGLFTQLMSQADVALSHIRSIGNEWAATVQAAPAIPHGQLIVWTAQAA